MNQSKAEAIRLIESLPEDCTLDDIRYHLYVLDKIEKGIESAESGELVPAEEVERRMAEWVKSAGRRSLSRTSKRSSTS